MARIPHFFGQNNVKDTFEPPVFTREKSSIKAGPSHFKRRTTSLFWSFQLILNIDSYTTQLYAKEGGATKSELLIPGCSKYALNDLELFEEDALI